MSNRRLQKITIHGYKSIKKLDDFGLNKLNVLIGANGSGKSNFLSVFSLLNDIYHQDLQKHVAQKGSFDNLLHFGKKRTESILINLNFGQNMYSIELLPNEQDGCFIKSDSVCYYYSANNNIPPAISIISANAKESEIKNLIDDKSSWTPSERPSYRAYTSQMLSDLILYHFHDTSNNSPIKGKCAANDNIALKRDAKNIAPFLYKLKKEHSHHYKMIVQQIKLVAPFFYDFETSREDEDVALEWYHIEDKQTPLKANLLSDGTLRFICLATLLMQPKELMPSTILIDEPELGLHPFAISVLVDMLKAASVENQVIVSTQSVELLNYLEAEDIIVVDQEKGVSTFKRLNAEELRDWLEIYHTIGELWKTNMIGGRP